MLPRLMLLKSSSCIASLFCLSFVRNVFIPATIRDNAPYTIEAWILNPEIAENECVADFTSSHDELEKLMLVNGTEPRCGVMNHYGWYEDAGYKEINIYVAILPMKILPL
jgi:hypothetical protein